MNVPAQPNTFRAGPDERGHFGLYGGRFVAETLMPLDPRAREGLRGGEGRSGLPRRARPHLNTHYTGRPEPALFRRAADRASARGRRAPARAAAQRSTSSATSSITPARTRSTTASARSCSPAAWARRASSPRPAPASTASPPPPSPRASGFPASSTWARPTSSGRSPTSSA